jgi:hypothetical protein
MRCNRMKKTILFALIAIICFLIILIAVACVKPILPGSYVEIICPYTGAVVPTEFSVLAVAAKWSFGVRTDPLLFFGSPKSHVGLPPSVVELSVDGIPYGRSFGGNHHVFRIVALPPGEHTLSLATPYGKTEIAVHVTDVPPVAFAPFTGAEEDAASVDALTKAVFDFVQTSPVFPFSGNTGGTTFRRIFLAEDGAFVLFGQMKERWLSACEVRYIASIGPGVTAEDIRIAPVVLSWDAADRPEPAKLTAVETGGDRLYLAIIDERALTLLSVFPDGAIRNTNIPLSSIAPDLPGAIAGALYPEIRTKAYRDFLFMWLDTYGTAGAPGHFDILYSAGTTKSIDLGGYDVDGISPSGHLIAFYPAPFTGPFETRLANGESLTKTSFPLPGTGAVYSFTGGSFLGTDNFVPEHPRFEIGPLVPCVGCTKNYVPPHYGVAGDVTFGPDILRSWIAGREGYFRMTPSR